MTFPVTDIARSVAFYKRLGFNQIVAAPHYARFECRPGGPSFSVDLVEAVDQCGILVYFECEDVDARVAQLKERGIGFEADPTDQPWLWREAYLRDPDGHRICLYTAGENRLNPPWRMN